MNVSICLLFVSLSWPSLTTWFPSTKWLSRISMILSQRPSWTRSSIPTGPTSPLLSCNRTHLKPLTINMYFKCSFSLSFLYASTNMTRCWVTTVYAYLTSRLCCRPAGTFNYYNYLLLPGGGMGPLSNYNEQIYLQVIRFWPTVNPCLVVLHELKTVMMPSKW